MNQSYLGIMVDCSRNAVMSVDALKRLIDALQKMGYNMLMLYTEDTYEIDGQEKFGYLRGRYTKDELCELAAYSKSRDIEMIPCIQTLAHLEGIFKRLNMPVIKCFRKDIEWKQSNKYKSEREQIQNVIKIDKSELLGVKHVLIVDDVLTSGSTIKTMISQIPPNILKKVLVLSSNCRILKNEIV